MIFLPVIIIDLFLLVITGLLAIADRLLINYGECKITVNENGVKREFFVAGGGYLHSYLIENRINIAGSCAGRAACGYCKVRVLNGGGEMLPTEEGFISQEEKRSGMRLACQVKIKDDLEIYIPDYLTTVKNIVKNKTYDPALKWQFIINSQKHNPPDIRRVKLSSADNRKLTTIIEAYKPGKRDALLAALQETNQHFGYLPEGALKAIAKNFRMSLSEVFGITTFYDRLSLRPRGKYLIRLCLGTTCYLKGAKELLTVIEEKLGIKTGETTRDMRFTLETVRCLGCCAVAPVIKINENIYGSMTGQKVRELLEMYKRSEKKSIPEISDTDFFIHQTGVILRNSGKINPERIDDYIARDGYRALAKALGEMQPAEIINEIKKSGLRGRGGEGFPAGIKWELCKKYPGETKYVICNADEGNPGSYTNRCILESDPHAILEGMIIGARAVGARQGYIYVRSEYQTAVRRLQIAVAQAKEHGVLGENIFNTDFSFALHIKQGAGAFICGEETALIASIEGRLPEPRNKPPYPAQSGLWASPTVVNNVETWATIPVIIARGADWFCRIGTEKSKGTKIFSLVGKIKKPGLLEVPMGISLKKIIFDIGGGVLEGKKIKAVLIGGPAGGCIPLSLLELPVDYEKLAAAGIVLGSGGIIVVDEDTCIVDIARYLIEFAHEESCGKCSSCRDGSTALLKILERICRGQGEEQDINLLIDISQAIKETSICGFGRTLPNTLLDTLRYFRDEYEIQIKERRCLAKRCGFY
ncbi:MAG: NADH-quinone oxidoreductase subunit NuoE [Candidatus Omnitrophota bacterium]